MSASTVNPTLTPNRPNRLRPTRAPRQRRNVVENDDYAAFVRRVINAYGRRIAGGDIEGLTTLTALAHQLDDVLEHAILGLRDSGFSWNDIATRLGVSRQAAHKRFTSATIDADPEYQAHANHKWPGDPQCSYCPSEEDIRDWEDESS